MNNLDILAEIDENTFVISDTHWRHVNVCWFATMRLRHLMKMYPEIEDVCKRLIEYRKQYEGDQHINNAEIQQLKKVASPYHDKMITEYWNDAVTDNDIVLVMGDFAFKNIADISPDLNGRKVLLLGNHDKIKYECYLNSGWECVINNINLVQDGYVFSSIEYGVLSNVLITDINNKRVLFSHFPLTIEHPADLKRYSKNVELYNELFDKFNCDINIHGHTHHFTVEDERCINVSAEQLELEPTQIKEVLNNV